MFHYFNVDKLYFILTVAIPRLHIPAAGGRIVDGDNANIQDYPYQVSIEYNGKYICSGSIIHELHVLTAAHCTDLRLIKDFKVRTSTSEQKKGGLLIDVDNICQHSKYDPLTFEYDVSVLTLTHNITFGPNAKAILLANDTAAPIAEGTIANVTGWGSVWAIGPTSPQLQVTKVALVGQANCQNSYGACDPITDKMLCFNNTRTGNDVCRVNTQ